MLKQASIAHSQGSKTAQLMHSSQSPVMSHMPLPELLVLLLVLVLVLEDVLLLVLVLVLVLEDVLLLDDEPPVPLAVSSS